MAKVIVGMSGGVDSSITAHLLKEQGYAVEGVSFILYEARMKQSFTGCCSIEAIKDASNTASELGVKHSSIDLREEFMEKVIEPFISAYCNGMTPNPCIMCNKHIKFPYLLKAAQDSGADFIATGHYARIQLQDGQYRLMKGVDSKKDQSYVLYVLKTEDLKKIKLPLGTMTKNEVREIAQSLNIPAAKRPESQEICFVEDNDYCRFMDGLSGNTCGKIIEAESGAVLGRHNGIHLYTIGQRKRLGISTGKPLYVTKIDPKTNIVYVGDREFAMAREFFVEDINWLCERQPRFTASVKVRSTMQAEPAEIETSGEFSAKIIFNEPQWAPAPGQSAVFYKGDTVIGGGIITEHEQNNCPKTM
jgi:tRNA-specific 2-thiouridylase